ncbi:MAG TPA: phosphopantetheine-binding protein [Thermoanaerobaculia bacterium]|nr:phosphopantetheine-binding protein [Thermoanaerobaculia bacterium]
MGELDRVEVTERVQRILADVLNLDQPPAPSARLVDDLGAESIDVLSLIFELEEAFGRSVSDERIAAIATVDDLVDEVLRAAP